MTLAGLGIAIPHGGTTSSQALVPGLHITRAEALAARSAMLHGDFYGGENTDPDLIQPDSSSLSKANKGMTAGEGPITSLLAQENAQREFQGQAATPAMIQNGIDQYNLMTDATLPGKWTSLGPDWAPMANNPDPITGNQLAVSGRVSALAVVPSTCNSTTCGTMYVGPANGGVWKTIDGGSTWTPLTDHLLNEAMGFIAVDPVNPNIIYVGTGEPNTAGDANRGVGIIRSTDGGQTWTQLDRNDFVNRSISSIIVDPRTAGSTNATLFVASARAANGSDYSQGAGCSRCTPGMPSIGFYKSTDGGNTFTLSNPAGVDPHAGSQTLVMDAGNPNTLYLGISGDAANAARGYYAGAGLYKSTDDGTTWSQLTTGLPTAMMSSYSTSAHAYVSVPRIDRITVAVGTNNPNVVYAAYGIRARRVLLPSGQTATAVAHEEIYRSTDAGATFSKLGSTPNACSSQCWYDMPLAVDPTNSDIVYAGGSANYDWTFGGNRACYTFYPFVRSCNTSLMKSTDGGQTWRDVAENESTGTGLLHPDNHIILVVPNYPNVVFTGDDGGLFHSADGGHTWNDLNRNLDTLQAESVTVGPTGNVFFGTQDNGTYRLTPGSTTALHVGYGDGGVADADPLDPNVAYYTQYGGFMERDDTANAPSSTHWNPFSNGSGTFVSPAWAAFYFFGRGLFYEPNAVSSVNDNIVFQATDTLYRSTNKGGVDTNRDWDATGPEDISTWAPISPTLSPGVSISAIAPSPTDANTLAYATTNGRVFITHNALAPVQTHASSGRSCILGQDIIGSLDGCYFDGGVSWTEVSSGLPGRWITSLQWDPRGSGSLYATASSFGALTPANPGHVYYLAAGNTSWTSIDGQNASPGRLADLPTNSIVINPKTGHIYVAMDYGVFVSTNNGQSWKRWDEGLPNVPIYMMAYDKTTDTLAVSTHGRGIWALKRP